MSQGIRILAIDAQGLTLDIIFAELIIFIFQFRFRSLLCFLYKHYYSFDNINMMLSQ